MTQLHDVERRRVIASNLLRPIALYPAWIFIVCDEGELNLIAAVAARRSTASAMNNKEAGRIDLSGFHRVPT